MKRTLVFVLALLFSCSVLGFAGGTKTVKTTTVTKASGETVTKKVTKVHKVKKQKKGETATAKTK